MKYSSCRLIVPNLSQDLNLVWPFGRLKQTKTHSAPHRIRTIPAKKCKTAVTPTQPGSRTTFRYGGDAIRRLLWHAYALFKKTGDIRYSRLRHARTVSGTRFAGCVQNCRRIRHQRLCRDQPADARPLTKRHFLQGCRDAHE